MDEAADPSHTTCAVLTVVATLNGRLEVRRIQASCVLIVQSKAVR